MQAFYEATVSLGVAFTGRDVHPLRLRPHLRAQRQPGNGPCLGFAPYRPGRCRTRRDFYGVPGSNGTVFPTLAPAGPDDTDEGSGARGRWIPTVAVDQYALPSLPGLALGTQILPQSFRIWGDSARLPLDSWVRVRSGPETFLTTFLYTISTLGPTRPRYCPSGYLHKAPYGRTLRTPTLSSGTGLLRG